MERNYEYEYYKEEIKRCFLCNNWIENQIKRHKVNGTIYYYHLTPCFDKIQKKFGYKSICSSSLQKI